LRYTELNPLRARLVSEPELWPWSSAAIHCGTNQHHAFLALDAWRRHWTVTTWREYLGEGEIESKLAVIRQRTHTGRPLGTAEFVQDLEKPRNGSWRYKSEDHVKRLSQINGNANSLRPVESCVSKVPIPVSDE